MSLSSAPLNDPARALVSGAHPAPQASAVSWGAILAGAVAAAALSLILLILGTGLGLSSVSPWSHSGVSATTLGVSTILWVTLTQVLASGLGGYLAGRLRTRWLGVHTDEVYFRDTAHGFLSWAVALLATAALLSSVIASILSTGAQAGASVAGGVANAASSGAAAVATTSVLKPDHPTQGALLDPSAYFVDTLFRTDPSQRTTPLSPSAPEASLAEVTRIFVMGLNTGSLAPEDLRYVGQVVAQRTGLSQPDAEKRVADTFARAQNRLSDAETTAREAADKARKASAYSALWMFISLLGGAFFASFAATFGGRQRDL